jgi:hypothetical protein
MIVRSSLFTTALTQSFRTAPQRVKDALRRAFGADPESRALAMESMLREIPGSPLRGAPE